VLSARLLAVHATVVDVGSLTGAAAVMGYTTSAVSQQLARLEAQAGVPLFEKSGRGVRPTAAGMLLADHAERVLREVADAEAALADLRAGRTGRLRIISFHSAGESLLPPAVADLRRALPGVHIMPIVDETDGALRRLRAGEVELVVVVEEFGRGDEPEDDLLRWHLLDDEYRLLLPHDHPLARRRTVPLEDLVATDWIITTGPVDYVRDATVAACRRAGFVPRVVAEADEFPVTQGYVAAGLGVALVPLIALGAVRPGVTIRRLNSPPPPRYIWLATRPALSEQPSVTRMVEGLRAAAVRAAQTERRQRGK
jgi:DNA-binding transcriptional LysR family regulator